MYFLCAVFYYQVVAVVERMIGLDVFTLNIRLGEDNIENCDTDVQVFPGQP